MLVTRGRGEGGRRGTGEGIRVKREKEGTGGEGGQAGGGRGWFSVPQAWVHGGSSWVPERKGWKGGTGRGMQDGGDAREGNTGGSGVGVGNRGGALPPGRALLGIRVKRTETIKAVREARERLALHVKRKWVDRTEEERPLGMGASTLKGVQWGMCCRSAMYQTCTCPYRS